MTTEKILVQKRNSREKEPLNIEKIHQMVEFACEDITGVSASQVEMKSGLQFFDGISTQANSTIWCIFSILRGSFSLEFLF